ncbi:MAG: hypothetical protein ACOVQL_11210 [Limnohabitans sp.]
MLSIHFLYDTPVAHGFGWQRIASNPAALQQLGDLVGASAADIKQDMVAHFEALAADVMAALDKSTDKGPHRLETMAHNRIVLVVLDAPRC